MEQCSDGYELSRFVHPYRLQWNTGFRQLWANMLGVARVRPYARAECVRVGLSGDKEKQPADSFLFLNLKDVPQYVP